MAAWRICGCCSEACVLACAGNRQEDFFGVDHAVVMMVCLFLGTDRATFWRVRPFGVHCERA